MHWYTQLADLIASPAFHTLALSSGYGSPAQLREQAVLRAAVRPMPGGHGLTADCPAALRQLIDHAEAFPAESARQKMSRVTRLHLFREFQSTIGLAYYRGCEGVAADRDRAYEWLGRLFPTTNK
ncbi:hypothetical protein [Pseudorhodoferax sp.]|uniref:hypothetical protein n=1 Tax=Pseudorhodoferax sp. TaxID=1993553 RepID=UPI0039E26722